MFFLYLFSFPMMKPDQALSPELAVYFRVTTGKSVVKTKTAISHLMFLALQKTIGGRMNNTFVGIHILFLTSPLMDGKQSGE